MNPTYGSFVLEPSISRLGTDDQLPTYPDILRELHTDLESITIGLALYLREYGVPPEPRRR